MIQESCQDNFRSCLRNFFPGRERKTSKICQNLSPRFSCEQSPIQLKRCFLIYIGIFFTRKNLELHTNTQWEAPQRKRKKPPTPRDSPEASHIFIFRWG